MENEFRKRINQGSIFESVYENIIVSMKGEVSRRLTEEIHREARKTINGERVTTEEGVLELETTLKAIIYVFPEMNSCKGLKYLAAVFLEIARDEEVAFWLLATNLITRNIFKFYVEVRVWSDDDKGAEELNVRNY